MCTHAHKYVFYTCHKCVFSDGLDDVFSDKLSDVFSDVFRDILSDVFMCDFRSERTSHHDITTWLLKDVSRAKAEHLLQSCPHGTFLIRCRQHGGYALSIK